MQNLSLRKIGNGSFRLYIGMLPFLSVFNANTKCMVLEQVLAMKGRGLRDRAEQLMNKEPLLRDRMVASM